MHRVDASSRFAPVPDRRPHESAWPVMTWPVPENVVLTGETVELAALDPVSDAGQLLSVLDHDEVWAHVPGRPKTAQEFEDAWRTKCALPDWHPWVLRTRRAIGEVPVGGIVGTSSYVDAHLRDAGLEIGFTLYAPAVWGTAVNPEAKLLLFGYAFDSLHAGRVQLKTDTRNHRSQQAIAHLGATYEGTLRRHFRRENGTIRDSVLFSVIADEWPQVRQRLTQRIRSTDP